MLARSIYARVALRDLGLLAATLAVWQLEAPLRGAGGAGSATLAGLAGVLSAVCAYLAHEWGHLAGARLGGALVHPPERVGTVFLFKFDSDRNDRRGFLWMSCGGFLASALGLALLLAVLPLDALAGRVALGLALLGVLATAALELPPFFRVARGGPIPRGLGYRASERSGAPA
jgi:hypothetical protein